VGFSKVIHSTIDVLYIILHDSNRLTQNVSSFAFATRDGAEEGVAFRGVPALLAATIKTPTFSRTTINMLQQAMTPCE
jgi:hypothetical protein